MDPLNPDPLCNPTHSEPADSIQQTQSVSQQRHRYTTTRIVDNNQNNSAITCIDHSPNLSLVSVIDMLFTGLRDDKSTRAVAQKLLLAIEAENQQQQKAGTTCHACGQAVPQRRKE